MKEVHSQEERLKEINKVGIVTIVGNFALSIGKLLAGIFGHSMAMISDAIHSASDVISTFIVLVGAKISSNKPDKEHNYGHEKFESIATVLLAMVLFATACGLMYTGIKSVISAINNPAEFVKPTIAALVAAVVSILVKEGMYWYTIIYSKRLNSQALKADAWHHRSDALSSIGSFAGILGAMLGVYMLDGIATMLISLLILKVSITIVLEVLKQLTDHAAPEELLAKVVGTINSNDKVLHIDDIKSRISGNVIYVEAEIAVDCTLSLIDAHNVAEEVHNQIEQEFPEIKHITIHVNPHHNGLPV